jgi:prepilin signal peptidase PulO-like enzyme (type II secretory pathway)
MNTFVVIAAAILGTIVGSALSVTITRTRTGANLGKRSRCLSCGKVLSASELIPVFSWLLQGGRCKSCRTKIPAFYPALEITTAAVFALTTYAFLWLAPGGWFGNPIFWMTLFSWLVLSSVMIFLGVYDIRHLKLHSQGLWVLLAAGIVMGVFGIWTGTQYIVLGAIAPELLLVRVFAAAVAAMFLYALWFLSNGKWFGSGDVPILVLSVFLFGTLPALSALAIAAWVAVLWAIAMWLASAIVQKKFTRTGLIRKLPFLPFIFIGIYVVGVWGLHVFGIIGGTL